MREEVERWIKMAKDDFDSARSNFENKKYYVCAFLSQQAAEKALKAILLEKTKKIIKIHNLVILGRKVNLPNDLLDKCKLLSIAYLETRYELGNKIPSEKFSEENSLKYLNIAKEILSWVEKNI
ncbi:MAG: HEPN domain-containing protein [Nanoarchaeota archaeon]